MSVAIIATRGTRNSLGSGPRSAFAPNGIPKSMISIGQCATCLEHRRSPRISRCKNMDAISG